MADLHHLGRAEGRRRAAELLDRFDLVDAAKKPAADLLRRHAAPARPRDDPGRRPAHHLPRRADHRPRPAQPPHHVADHPRPRRRRRHDLPHHAVPGRGRRARRPDRGPRPRQAGRRGHRGRAQAPHPRRPRPPAVRRRRRTRIGRRAPSATASRDDDALTLQVPSDGSVRSLRALLDRLDDAAIEVDGLSVHTPDLDDVFLALTGHPTTEKESPAMSTLSYAVRDSATMLRRNLRHMLRYPSMTLMRHRHAGHLPAAVRLRLRRHARRRARRRRRAAAPTTSTTSPPASS